MRYFNLKYISAALLLSIASSCNVVDQAPEASLAPDQVFTDATGANAAIIGAYSALQSANYVGLRTWSLLDLYAGNLRHPGTFPSFAQFLNRNILADNTEVTNMWTQVYAAINRSNNVIAFVPAIEDASLNKDRIIAEAKFLRAFSYLNAIVLWGGDNDGFSNDAAVGVPLRLLPTLTPADAAPTPRVSLGEIKAAILNDLSQTTIDALAARGTGSNQAVVGRATREAAIALRAKAQLLFGNYADAATLAQSIITGTGSDLTAVYANLFSSKNAAESLWELQFDAVNSNTIAFFFYPTANGGRNEYDVATNAVFPHEAGDARAAVNGVGTTLTSKYTAVNPGIDNVKVLRKAEMYLIAAEALVRQDAANLPTALNLLNAVRSRAGLAAFTTADVNVFLTQLFADKRVELAFEGFPTYWSDLRRTNTAAPLFANANRVRLPIPQREVLTSSNVISQNLDY